MHQLSYHQSATNSNNNPHFSWWSHHFSYVLSIVSYDFHMIFIWFAESSHHFPMYVHHKTRSRASDLPAPRPWGRVTENAKGSMGRFWKQWENGGIVRDIMGISWNTTGIYGWKFDGMWMVIYPLAVKRGQLEHPRHEVLLGKSAVQNFPVPSLITTGYLRLIQDLLRDS